MFILEHTMNCAAAEIEDKLKITCLSKTLFELPCVVSFRMDNLYLICLILTEVPVIVKQLEPHKQRYPHIIYPKLDATCCHML